MLAPRVTAKSGSKEYFYIRSGTSSVIAKGEVLDELRELASRVPFDERGNDDIQLEDISLVLLRDYLVKVGSRLADQVATTPLPKILDQMELYTGPKENHYECRNTLCCHSLPSHSQAQSKDD